LNAKFSISFQTGRYAAALLAFVLLSSCQSRVPREPSLEFSRVPPAGDGSPDKVDAIAGRVQGARPGNRIVLFARSGVWWVQPLADKPFTAIQQDATWKSVTHPGSAYAALLVDSRYHPPLTVNALPEKGGSVLAVATVPGTPRSARRTIQFAGYQWETREAPADYGGARNVFDPANVWTDQQGFLHLHISRRGNRWVSAELKLARSLGYGSYRFVVGDVAHLEPATVLALFTWDDFGPPREMDIEISRWGEPQDKNAQFVIQPYVVPANTIRFTTPPGTLTYWIDWQPGRAAFKTFRGSSASQGTQPIAEHVFTSGIPSPGDERVHFNFYVFNNRRNPMQREAEVIVEKFEFLP
jgi:hypothetical protein